MLPEHGYPGVDEETDVVVVPGSQAPADARSRFRCDYAFAWLAEKQALPEGWLSVDILAGKGHAAHGRHAKNLKKPLAGSFLKPRQHQHSPKRPMVCYHGGYRTSDFCQLAVLVARISARGGLGRLLFAML